MNIIGKAFNEEWISSNELRMFAEDYEKKFGQIKRAIVGGLLAPVAFPIGAAIGVASQLWDVVFVDQGQVMTLRRRGISADYVLKKVKNSYPNGSKFAVFEYPDEKVEKEAYKDRLTSKG